MKHYELTEETIDWYGHTLHRIKATKDLPQHGIMAGALGGFVESEKNLSDDAWVFDDAKVYGYAEVCGNALVDGHAQVFGGAKVYGNAWVFGGAKVYGNAEVCGDAIVSGYAEVYGYAKVFGDAWVFGEARMHGNAQVFDNAKVYENVVVCENAVVRGDAAVCGNAWVFGDAVIQSNEDYIVFKNWWSSGRYFTWTRSNDMWLVGCFYGTGEELIKKAYKDSELSGKCYEQTVKYAETINNIMKQK